MTLFCVEAETKELLERPSKRAPSEELHRQETGALDRLAKRK
jgi:hypothetical protein